MEAKNVSIPHRYDPNSLLDVWAQVYLLDVSIPHRYDPNSLLDVWAQVYLLDVSIPHRYDPNRPRRASSEAVGPEFQFLIGTIQTDDGPGAAAARHDQFQFLIGTIQTAQQLRFRQNASGFNSS